MRKCLIYFIVALFSYNPSALFAEDDLLEKAIAEYKNENYEEALEILIKEKENRPESSSLAFYLGLSFKMTGDYDKATRNLKDALSFPPIVKEAYVELIDALNSINKLEEAEKWILKAEKENIMPANVALLKGQILAKKGDNKGAVEAYNRAKELDSSFSQTADFQIAVAYTMDRKYKEAKASLKNVIEADPLSELAAFAEEYKKSIDKTLKMHRTWSFTAGLLYQYDSNVISGPTETLVSSSGSEISGKGDSSLISTLRIDYTPVLNGEWFFNSKFNLYNNYHYNIETHDVNALTVSATPGYSLKKGAATLPLSYSYILLNGNDYMSNISVKPSLSIIFKPEHTGQFSMGYTKRELVRTPPVSAEERDGNVYSLSARYIRAFWGGKGMVNAAYQLSLDNARGNNWSNVGNRISVGALVPFKPTFTTLERPIALNH